MQVNQRKTYTEPNKTQVYYRDFCLKGAKDKLASPELHDVTITNEQVWEFNGNLSFILSIKAKPNTGMLFICDKSWHVVIGRRGSVKSQLFHKESRLTRNKYCIFI